MGAAKRRRAQASVGRKRKLKEAGVKKTKSVLKEFTSKVSKTARKSGAK